jgi:DNA-binding IclR family transcriptional regulator
LTLHQALQHQPVATTAALVAATGLTPATVNKTLAHLERIGVVAELTERRRGRVFAYRAYVELINAGLEDAAAAPPAPAKRRARAKAGAR